MKKRTNMWNNQPSNLSKVQKSVHLIREVMTSYKTTDEK